jgi:hypothetical protein
MAVSTGCRPFGLLRETSAWPSAHQRAHRAGGFHSVHMLTAHLMAASSSCALAGSVGAVSSVIDSALNSALCGRPLIVFCPHALYGLSKLAVYSDSHAAVARMERRVSGRIARGSHGR